MRRKVEGVDVVFLDAGGTLFEVRGSVGEVYARVGARHGIASNPAEVEAAFTAAIRDQPALAFDGLAGRELDRAEREWWLKIVRKVFPGRIELNPFFDEVYELFRTAEPWSVFSDTRESLVRLRAAGFRLGVISNFDSRLDDVLSALSLDSYFESVVVSSRCGAAKPDPAIFRQALRSMSVEAGRAVHIGDSFRDDFAGARGAGLRAILLDRNGERESDDSASTLVEACDALCP